ncbi:S8 family serine peptidase [Aquibium sp. ELW1220]|uniref:S8 family peptidase n=1 Tax=Aquibium sp. ELW1220 TaxID=2976766 RepID=UPI0025B00ECB|nr:S8 family serine peptidase [Aquibium sp. ELW1220]MDN2580151.1 S8 family serine peptidase [Aquibium sp. ELW1220]
MTFHMPPRPVQLPSAGPVPGGHLALHESDALVQFREVHKTLGLFGQGTVVAVVDTGCNLDHRDFLPNEARVAGRVNLSGTGASDVVSDIHGHGTHVTGAIAAHGIHPGVAPQCRIVPVKVMRGDDTDTSDSIRQGMIRGLEWVLANAEALGISVVCLSMGNDRNLQSDAGLENDPMTLAVKDLFAMNIPVVASAGNYYGLHATQHDAVEGMCFPAILRETISVGAVYDEPCNSADKPCSLGPEFGSPFTSASKPDQLTIYTQRMAKTADTEFGTDIFAPGSWVKSSGIGADNASSRVMQGTSQAAPITAGVIALMQSAAVQAGKKPRLPIAMIRDVLRSTAVRIRDDSTLATPRTTRKEFLRVHAPGAVKEIRNRLALIG